MRNTMLDKAKYAALKSAFAELNKIGIIATQRLGITKSDGDYQMQTIIDDLRLKGQPVLGGVSYDEQDDYILKQHGLLYLRFSDYDNDTGTDAMLPIARTAIDVLQRHGLSSEWDGTHSKRVIVDLRSGHDRP